MLLHLNKTDFRRGSWQFFFAFTHVDECFVAWNNRQEDICMIVVWICHIKNLLRHYIEADGFLVAVAFQGVLDFSTFVSRYHKSEDWIVALENPFPATCIDVFEGNLRSPGRLIESYLYASVMGLIIAFYDGMDFYLIYKVVLSAIFPVEYGRVDLQLAAFEEVCIDTNSWLRAAGFMLEGIVKVVLCSGESSLSLK